MAGGWRGLVNPVPVSMCRAMGADTVIAVNLNGDLVTKYRRYVGRHGETARKSEAKAEAELWEKLAAQLRSGLQERAALVMSQLLGPREDLPGISTVLTAAINIMQDRITRSRMGGDPPDVCSRPGSRTSVCSSSIARGISSRRERAASSGCCLP